MECSVCMEMFNSTQRRPKTLPCGHSFCRMCLTDANFGRTCPIDRKGFMGPIARLPDNFSLLGLLAEQPERVTYYCRDCDQPSSEACVLELKHRLSSVRQLRAEHGEPQLRKLQRGAATARAAVRLLEQEGEELHVRLESWRSCLDQFQDDEVKLRAALQAAAPGLGRTLDAVDAQVAPLERSARLLAVGGAATLVLAGDGGTFWRADVELPAEGAQDGGGDGQPAAKRARAAAGQTGPDTAVRLLRHVLLQLQRDDLLKEAGPECRVQPQLAVEVLSQLESMEAKFTTPAEVAVLAGMTALRSLRLKGPLPEGLVTIPALESLHLDFMQERCNLERLFAPKLQTLSISCWRPVLELRLPAWLPCRRLELCLAGQGRVLLSPEPSPLAACLEEVVVKADTTDLQVFDAGAGRWRRRGALLLDALAADLVRAGLRALRRVLLDRGAWAYRGEGAHRADDCARQLRGFKDTLDAVDEAWAAAVAVSCSVCGPIAE